MLSYGQPSEYVWTDDSGTQHTIRQGEGGEQGDPLMPALYALAQHRALEVAQSRLQPGEVLIAYLDDVYVVCRPERAVPVFNIVTAALREHAGVEANLGKCKMWNKAGMEPPGVGTLGTDVWVGGGGTAAPARGIKVLGSPVGTPEFVQAHNARRQAEEQAFLDMLPDLPDLQCAWALLLNCAVPRCNHLIRSLPPSLSDQYAREHDRAIQGTLGRLVDTQGEADRVAMLSSMPLGLGGLGLRSAQRTRASAYWASWADALPMLRRRAYQVAQALVEQLARTEPATA
jgi:hypothetical protein